jgi:hypothetical protein
MALGLTLPLTEISTRNLSWGIVRPAQEADNLTANHSRLSRKCKILDVPEPYRPPWPVTGKSYTFLTSSFLLSDFAWLMKLKGQRYEIVSDIQRESQMVFNNSKDDFHGTSVAWKHFLALGVFVTYYDQFHVHCIWT